MSLRIWYVSKYVALPSSGTAGGRAYLLMKELALLGNQADLGELIGDGLLIFNLESTCVGSRVVRRIFSTLHRTNPIRSPSHP